ncbi:MAG: M1 family metallopeptidase [Phaeodactylibacter sp.]|nr:M1 family metallopeptidase [Phaeodactylibacter sp.]
MHPFLFYISLLLSAFAKGAPTTALANQIDVLHYQVNLALEPHTRYLQGETQITIRHKAEVKELALSFGKMEVAAVQVNERQVAFSYHDAHIFIPFTGGDTNSVVKIRYKGVPDIGLYSKEYKGQLVVYTDSWPDRGRGWLPGVHHPSDPATFTLNLELPFGYEAIATGRLRAVDKGNGQSRYFFEMNKPVPTYSFAFAVSDFSVTEEHITDSLVVRYCLLKPDSGYAYKLDFIPEVLAFFSEQIGPYPFSQFAAVQIPLGYPGMENAATAFIRAERFEDGRLAGVIAHEAAHQWFGNTIVIDSWRDLWLNEGIATYLTTLYQGHADGMEKSLRVWAGMAEVGPGREPAHHPLASADSSSSGIRPRLTWEAYEKGASVLHTLRLKIGDAAFFSGLREAYRQYSETPLTTEGFQEVMEQTSGLNLDTFFKYWVHGNTLPRLQTTWDESLGILRWEVMDGQDMLKGIPFLLEVTQGDQPRYVAADQGSMHLPSNSKEPPSVRPVGVMMYVE